MLFYNYDINLTDVPDEICLSFAIAGCQLNCKDCFWQELDTKLIKPLTFSTYKITLNQYQSYISCVLFYGGEWCKSELIEMLIHAKQLNLKTCLYTGQTFIDNDLKEHLDYLKLGPYSKKHGNLSQPTTNQKFLDVKHNQDITSKFWHSTINTRGNR